MFDNANKNFCTLANVANTPGTYRESSHTSQNSYYLNEQSTYESNAISYPRRLPFALEQAKGVYLKDVDGNVYYDCLSGAGALALGHNHEIINTAITKLLDSNAPLLTLDITTPIKHAFTKELLNSLPDAFSRNAKIQFCSPSGSDAIEAAIKLVKTATGRHQMMAFHGGYHGMTQGALGMTGNVSVKNPLGGLSSNVQFLPYPYMYRYPFGKIDDPNGNTIIDYIENILTDSESGITKPAGIVVEIIQGEGGKIPAPNHWIRELRRITIENNIPLIIDEVQTGFGRTGRMFAFEHSGITPDVIVLSKALGGSLPLAVIAYHNKYDTWEPGAHAGTFRGNQLAMATGTAVIQYIKSNNLVDHAFNMGKLLMHELKNIQRNTMCIGDVRGKGLMIGTEIVNIYGELCKAGNPVPYPELSSRIQCECFSHGLVLEIGGRQSSVLRFMPALIVTEQQIRHICEIFLQAVISAEKYVYNETNNKYLIS